MNMKLVKNGKRLAPEGSPREDSRNGGDGGGPVDDGYGDPPPSKGDDGQNHETPEEEGVTKAGAPRSEPSMSPSSGRHVDADPTPHPNNIHEQVVDMSMDEVGERAHREDAGAREHRDDGHVSDMSKAESEPARQVDDMSGSEPEAGSGECDAKDDLEIRTRLQQRGWTETRAWVAPTSGHAVPQQPQDARDSGDEEGGGSVPKPKSQAAIDKAKEREEDAKRGVKPLGAPAEVRLHPTMSAIGRASRVAAYAKAVDELDRMEQGLARIYSALPAIRAGTAFVTIAATDAPAMKPVHQTPKQAPPSPPSQPEPHLPASTVSPKQPALPAAPITPNPTSGPTLPQAAPKPSIGRAVWANLCLAWVWFWGLTAPAAVALWLLAFSSPTSVQPSTAQMEKAR